MTQEERDYFDKFFKGLDRQPLQFFHNPPMKAKEIALQQAVLLSKDFAIPDADGVIRIADKFTKWLLEEPKK